MKVLWYIAMLVFLLVQPCFGFSDSGKTVQISGTIGDFSTGSKTYEINGSLYTFHEGIAIQDKNGNPLDFSSLTGGVFVDIIGEKSYLNGKETVIYKKIIVSKK